jgi:hypothetical protein
MKKPANNTEKRFLKGEKAGIHVEFRGEGEATTWAVLSRSSTPKRSTRPI